MILIASIALSLILIVLIIILCGRKKMNSNLMENVNNEKFQQNQNKVELFNNDNED